MINIDIKTILIFTGINLIYVILGCLKDICRQKAPKQYSAIIATITYVFYIFIIKSIVDIPTYAAILGTAISNFLGDYLGRIISEHLIPRGIICYRFTIPKEFHDINNINNYLEEHDFGYKWETGYSLHKTYLSYQIYTKSKQEDKQIEALLSLYKIDKFNRSESRSFNLKKEE